MERPTSPLAEEKQNEVASPVLLSQGSSSLVFDYIFKYQVFTLERKPTP